MKLFKDPLKVEDAAGRRYTVIFTEEIKQNLLRAKVRGQGIDTEVEVQVHQPILNWGYWARQALRAAIRKTHNIEPALTKDDRETL